MIESTRQFILDAKYLGDIAIEITSNETESGVETLYAAAFDVLKKISVELEIRHSEPCLKFTTKETAR